VFAISTRRETRPDQFLLIIVSRIRSERAGWSYLRTIAHRRPQGCGSLRRERVEQRLRFLQIARIEPLREPPIDRSKQLAGLLRLSALIGNTISSCATSYLPSYSTIMASYSWSQIILRESAKHCS
jgi:hypothetical protein